MPIKWNPLPVVEAMDEAEEAIREAFLPLIKARTIVQKAQEVPKLPEYMKQHLFSLESLIGDNVPGKGWGGDPTPGRLVVGLQRVRDKIPAKDLARARQRHELGDQHSLV